MNQSARKILIANRGEIACRIIKSCRRLKLSPIAVFSDADKNALHVELADFAYPLGGFAPNDSYLKGDELIDIAKSSNADLLHPGYGFLAENASFAQKVIDADLTWVGPRPTTISDMGDKGRARELARLAGVPILPGSERIVEDDIEGLAKAGERIGYPLLVKAVAGGGGIGMRLVETSRNLLSVAEATQKMASRFFGDGTVFLERYVRRARHIEVQVFGFGDGRVVHFYERECSVQRRYQKIIEEAPAPNLPENIREAMTQAAINLAGQEHYSGTGTVEFIYDESNGKFYFLEMNTRIQVEHPVTEMITKTDLVELQLKLAMGLDLSGLTQQAVNQTGHALECRVYAENPSKMFLPSPGQIEQFVLPEQNETLRIESGVRSNDQMTPYYDPMIAKIVTHGCNRIEALSRMKSALGAIKLSGLDNNVNFLDQCIRHKAFAAGRYDTSFVDRHKFRLIPSLMPKFELENYEEACKYD